MTRHWTVLQQPSEWGDGSDIRFDERSSSSSSEISRQMCWSANICRTWWSLGVMPMSIQRISTCRRIRFSKIIDQQRSKKANDFDWQFQTLVVRSIYFVPSCKWKRFRLHFAFESCKTGTNNRPANHPYVEDAAIFEPTTSSDKRPPLGRWTAPALDWWTTLERAVLSSWNNFRSLPLAIPIANFVPPRPTSMPGKTLWKRTTTRWAGASTRKRSAGIFRSPDPPPCGRATGRSPDTTEPVNGVAFDR